MSKGLMDMIEGLLSEGANDTINQITADNQTKKKEHSSSPDTQGVLGKEKGAAMDAGGDKDVGGMEKGKFASDASADTQGIEGKTSGQAIDAGGDKDVGKIDGKTALPSGASSKVEADKGPHNLASDKGLGEEAEDETEAEEVVAEESEELEEKKCSECGDAECSCVKEEAEVTEESDELEEAKDKGDMDGDGKDEPDDKEYMDNKDAAIKKAMSKEEVEVEEGCGSSKKSMKEEDEDLEEEAETVEEAEGETLKKVSGEENREKRPDAEKGDNAPETKKSPFDGHAPHDQASDAFDTPTKANPKGPVSEESDDLDEDFKQRAEIIFETAVNEKAAMIREELETEFNTKLTEAKAELDEQVEAYVAEAVQEWINENALEIKYSLRTEIAENFMRGLKGLFEESYIEIPEEEYSVVDELTEAVESFKEQLETQNTALAEAKAELLTMKRSSIVESLSEDLTETQKIKLESLAEHVEAESIDEFEFKVKELKEGYFDPKSEEPFIASLTEEVFTGTAEPIMENVDPDVAVYANFLGKAVK